MRHFWSRKMLSVKKNEQSYGYDTLISNSLMQLASILQVKPAVVSEILAELQEQSLIAASPARQLAQVAIALRCGNSVKGGISHLQALSLPVAPVKLYGLKESFSALPETGSPGRQLLHGYEGFRTPCSLLNELPELIPLWTCSNSLCSAHLSAKEISLFWKARGLRSVPQLYSSTQLK